MEKERGMTITRMIESSQQILMGSGGMPPPTTHTHTKFLIKWITFGAF